MLAYPRAMLPKVLFRGAGPACHWLGDSLSRHAAVAAPPARVRLRRSSGLALWGASLLLVALAASQAEAQVMATLVRIGDQEVEAISPAPLNAKQCEADANVVFELRNVDTSAKNVDVWQGADCNTMAARIGDAMNCVYIGTKATEEQTQLEVEFPASQLACEGADKTVKLFFLPVTMSMAADDVTTFAEFSLEVDTLPPAAPTGVTGGSGQNQIPVSWDATESEVERFLVYWDAIPSDGACESDVIAAGDEVDPDSPPVADNPKVAGMSATKLNLGGGDINGDRAAVAVQAQDLAGNVSPLSEIVCVDVIPTVGYYERFQQNGGGDTEGFNCNLGAQPGNAAAWPLALALAALIMRRRRSS